MSASRSSSVKNGGRSGPSATRAAPVRVARLTISSGASSSASASASASTSRPSASVLLTSTVSPLRLRRMSPGRKALPEIAFSTAGISTRSRSRSPSVMIARARPSAVAAPPMSFFIRPIEAPGLMLSPPVSKHTPLPTSVTFGASEGPQTSSTSRGSAAAARPTAWIIGKPASSRPAPVTEVTPAWNGSASARTAASSAAGPMSAAGVLTRSWVSAIAPASASMRARSTPSGQTRRRPGFGSPLR
jgi:hypothetical protein